MLIAGSPPSHVPWNLFLCETYEFIRYSIGSLTPIKTEFRGWTFINPDAFAGIVSVLSCNQSIPGHSQRV